MQPSVWTHLFSSLRWGIAGSYGKSMFSIWRNSQSVAIVSTTSLPRGPPPVSPHPLRLLRIAKTLHPQTDHGILKGSGSWVCLFVCFLPRQVHLGRDHMSFKFRKDLAEERQRENIKYKVRVANSMILIALNSLNSCYMQEATWEEGTHSSVGRGGGWWQVNC